MRYKHRGHIHSPSTGTPLKPEQLEALLYGEPISVTLMKAQHAADTAAKQEVRLHHQEAKQVFRKQQKEEEAMSSLRESLEKAIAEKEERAAKLQATLDDWGDDEPVNEKPTTKETTVTTTTAPITLSVSQQTFEFIKANPGITVKNAVQALVDKGLNFASVSTLISQMVRNGMISRIDHALNAKVTYYRPIQVVKKAKHKQVRIITRPQPQAEAAAPAGIAALSKPDVAHNIKTLLDEISVNEARALYLELKKLFGGN